MNIKNFIKNLNEPYPYEYSAKRSLITAILFAAFVTAFLAIFHPFQVDYFTRDYGQIIYAGYGFVTFFVLLIMLIGLPKIIPYIFQEGRWKVRTEIIHILSIFIVIGFCNTVYSCFLGYSRLNLYTIFMFELFTLLIGIIPVTFIILAEQNRMLKKNLELAGTINSNLGSQSAINTKTKKEGKTFVELSSEIVKEKMRFPVEGLLLIKSEENYVVIITENNGSQKKKIFRCTLKNAEKALKEYNYFFRCHRSFIVNISKIEKVTGNSQGIKLRLSGFERLVPVSRSNIKMLKKLLS